MLNCLRNIMKQKSTTISLKKFSMRAFLVIAAFALLAYLPTFNASASTYDDQIAELQQKIDGYQKEAARLRGETVTLQNTIGELEAQKSALQIQINLSQAKYDQLLKDIETNQKKLDKQKRVYAQRVADLSANTQLSPIMLLAGSNSIGDFIRSDAYQSSIQSQIQQAIKQVKTIKQQLALQKQEVEGVLADQKKQHEQLAAKEAEQANILAQTQGSEQEFQNMISQSSAQVASLRAAQAAAMRTSSGSEGIVYGSSSYPWMDSTMAYNDYCQYFSGGSAADPWGYCKRQCVSYVAWKLNTDGMGNRGYSGLGNANNWSSGGSYVPMGDLQRGDVIIWYVGGYGHVMYVEYVSGGTVGISQMNVPYDSGQYSTATYSMGTLQSGAYEARRFH